MFLAVSVLSKVNVRRCTISHRKFTMINIPVTMRLCERWNFGSLIEPRFSFLQFAMGLKNASTQPAPSLHRDHVTHLSLEIRDIIFSLSAITHTVRYPGKQWVHVVFGCDVYGLMHRECLLHGKKIFGSTSCIHDFIFEHKWTSLCVGVWLGMCDSDVWI